MLRFGNCVDTNLIRLSTPIWKIYVTSLYGHSKKFFSCIGVSSSKPNLAVTEDSVAIVPISKNSPLNPGTFWSWSSYQGMA